MRPKRKHFVLNAAYAINHRLSLVIVGTAEKYHHVVEQSGEGAECCHDVGVGCGAKSRFRFGLVLRRGDACCAKPSAGALGGIDFNGKRDKAEERGQGKEDDADEEDGGKDLDEEYARKEHPLHPV